MSSSLLRSLAAVLFLAFGTPVPGAERPIFIELRLEVSTGPLRELPLDLVSGGESAFILHDLPDGRGLSLYPLRGRAIESTGTPTPLWVGIRATRMMVEGGAERSALLEAEGKLCEITSLEGLPPELFIPATVRVGEGDEVILAPGGKEVTVAPGQILVVTNKSLKVSLEELARRLARPPEETKESILARLRKTSPKTASLEIQARLVARHHGRVQVASFDALHEWERAREEFAGGHYDRASAHLARVLEALPQHTGALELKKRIAAAVGPATKGVILEGLIDFPAGAPTGAHRDLWKKFNPGVARLTSGDQVWSAPVRDGAFLLAAPPGAYRLELVVPGFQPATRNVTLSTSPLNLTIPLR